MISTYDTKMAQLRDGFYRTGTGSLQVFILGSCRTISFLNYLARWNRMGSDPMTITYINPFDWHWNLADEVVNFEKAIDSLETDERVLSVLRSSQVFIHEYFGNYGMFNTARDAGKNIYQFGMNAKVDISVPNFHDHFIFHNDFVALGDVPDNWSELGLAAVDKFCAICKLTDFPDMADYFLENWKKVRMFYTPNHTSKYFTTWLMRRMNDKFFQFQLTDDFWRLAGEEDMFASPCTEVTDLDRQTYGLNY